jgi:hypothetical protein
MALAFTEVLRDTLNEKAFRCYEVTCDGTTVSINAADLDLHYIDSAMVAGGIDVTGTVSITVSALADGVGSTLTVTLTGANIGDAVEVAGSQDMDDTIMTAYAQATDKAEIRLQDENAGNTTPANGYICRIRKSVALLTYTGEHIVFSPPLRSGDVIAVWAFGW